MGASIIHGYLEPPSIPQPPTTSDTWWDSVTYVFSMAIWYIEQIAYFFNLMAISSTVGIIGTLILAPFGIGLLWIIMEYLRGI